jgi:hypothetical protein
MGIFPHELPPILCAICGPQIGFSEQAVAVVDKDGRRMHWQCWLDADKPFQKD